MGGGSHPAGDFRGPGLPEGPAAMRRRHGADGLSGGIRHLAQRLSYGGGGAAVRHPGGPSEAGQRGDPAKSVPGFSAGLSGDRAGRRAGTGDGTAAGSDCDRWGRGVPVSPGDPLRHAPRIPRRQRAGGGASDGLQGSAGRPGTQTAGFRPGTAGGVRLPAAARH